MRTILDHIRSTTHTFNCCKTKIAETQCKGEQICENEHESGFSNWWLGKILVNSKFKTRRLGELRLKHVELKNLMDHHWSPLTNQSHNGSTNQRDAGAPNQQPILDYYKGNAEEVLWKSSMEMEKKLKFFEQKGTAAPNDMKITSHLKLQIPT